MMIDGYVINTFLNAMLPFFKLMKEHSDLVDRTNLNSQRTEIRGTWADWEYRLNAGIGDEPMTHQVVAHDFSRMTAA